MSEKRLDVANYNCKAVIGHGLGFPIIFLHGYSYTGVVWQRIVATTQLEEKKIPFLALDMPYGAHTDCQPHTRSIEQNVTFVNEALKTFFPSTIPILVGASLGAHIALQFASLFPVKGLLLVGAVRVLEKSLVQSYGRFNFPVRLIIGSEDRIASAEELRTLVTKLPNAKLTIYEGEGHSAYIGSAGRFKQDLLELYALAEQTS